MAPPVLFTLLYVKHTIMNTGAVGNVDRSWSISDNQLVPVRKTYIKCRKHTSFAVTWPVREIWHKFCLFVFVFLSFGVVGKEISTSYKREYWEYWNPHCWKSQFFLLHLLNIPKKALFLSYKVYDASSWYLIAVYLYL